MDKLNLQIINIETNGCAVQFRLGTVTDNKISKIETCLTVYFKFNARLYFPIEDDDFYTKDFIKRKIPLLLLLPPQYENDYPDDERKILVKEAKKPNSPIISVYHGDKMADVLKKFYDSKSIIYEE